jgi:hypothetical protein
MAQQLFFFFFFLVSSQLLILGYVICQAIRLPRISQGKVMQNKELA